MGEIRTLINCQEYTCTRRTLQMYKPCMHTRTHSYWTGIGKGRLFCCLSFSVHWYYCCCLIINCYCYCFAKYSYYFSHFFWFRFLLNQFVVTFVFLIIAHIFAAFAFIFKHFFFVFVLRPFRVRKKKTEGAEARGERGRNCYLHWIHEWYRDVLWCSKLQICIYTYIQIFSISNIFNFNFFFCCGKISIIGLLDLIARP